MSAFVFTWWWGKVERVNVLTLGASRSYVEWPESRRVIDGLGVVERPAGWVDTARLRYDGTR